MLQFQAMDVLREIMLFNTAAKLQSPFTICWRTRVQVPLS
jgi:hypothetical protein